MSEELNQNQEQIHEENKEGFSGFVEQQKVMVAELGRAIDAMFNDSFRTHASNAGAAFVNSFKAIWEGFKNRNENETTEGDDASPDRKVKVEVN